MIAESSSAQREALQTLKSDLYKLEQTSRGKRGHLISCEQAISKHKNDVLRLKMDVQQAETMVDELQDALEEESVEEGRLEIFKQHLQDAIEEKGSHQSAYEECVVAKDKNNELLKGKRDEMAKLDSQIKEAGARVLKAESKLTRCATQRSSALMEMNTAIEKVQAAREESETFHAEREQIVRCIEDFTVKANEICRRVPVDYGETYDSLERKCLKLLKDLKDAEQRYISSGTCMQEFANTTTELEVPGRSSVQPQRWPSRPSSKQTKTLRIWKTLRRLVA